MGDEINDWTEKTFGEFGKEVFEILTAPPSQYEETDEQVDFIDGLIDEYSENVDKILDVPCGNGRISLGLLDRGYDVTGIDICSYYIEQARSKVSDPNKCDFIDMDMRNIDYEDEFDVLINWFGSFGYFYEDVNKDMLERFTKALKPDGLLLMDLTNRDYILNKMRGFYEMNPTIVYEEGVNITYEYDLEYDRINVWVDLEKQGERLFYTMRYYTLREMKDLLEGCDLDLIKVYGDHDGGMFSLFSPRMILLGRRTVE